MSGRKNAGLIFHHEDEGGDGRYHVTTGSDAVCACGDPHHETDRGGVPATDPRFGFKPPEMFCPAASDLLSRTKPEVAKTSASVSVTIPADATGLSMHSAVIADIVAIALFFDAGPLVAPNQVHAAFNTFAAEQSYASAVRLAALAMRFAHEVRESKKKA